MNKGKNCGITLIALVITIVVLIILAGVSINLVFNENGIINRAKQARGEYENSKEEEQNHLVKVGDYVNSRVGKVKVNKPVKSQFNSTVTSYVTWTKNNLGIYEISDNIPISDAEPEGWYDYSTDVKKWANIKTAGNGNAAYWVWIPRYAYKIPAKGSRAETIEIKFLNGTSNDPTDGTSITISDDTTPGSWKVHPAFNFGGTELTGIWVAKFEASNNNLTETERDRTDLQVNVIPEVKSWQNIKVTNIFTVCRKMEQTGGVLGLTIDTYDSSNGIDNTTNIDTHMMKNNEWGAIAYLSMSKYGKNGQVWNNPYGDTGNYTTKTGRAGIEEAVRINIVETSAYNEGTGPNASTTGNVYGIYDMSGGSWEYVATYLPIGLENETRRGYSQTLYEAHNQYKDTYVYEGNGEDSLANYSANSDKYGDAIYETSETVAEQNKSWYEDYSAFLNKTHPILKRGGRFSSFKQAGLFSFDVDIGEKTEGVSFRPVLVCPSIFE